MMNYRRHLIIGKPFRPFIMEVDSSGNSMFIIQTTGGGYNYNVKTSDGQTFTGVTGNLTITFPSPNTRYDVEISGNFPRFYFSYGSERLKIKDTKQWGDIVWLGSQNLAFYGCGDMECSALDSPDFRDATNGNSMFSAASAFNPPNFALTLENLTNGTAMFQNASAFNPPNFAPTLENLINGNYMFFNATSFNPPNFAPTLENLTNGNNMFGNAINFAQDIYAPNSVNLENDTSMFRNTKIGKITMNNSSLITTDRYAFACSQLTDLILIDRKTNLWIDLAPLLLSTKIDALANSVADLTGFVTKNVIMTLAQRASCDQTLWTNKNWTIIAI